MGKCMSELKFWLSVVRPHIFWGISCSLIWISLFRTGWWCHSCSYQDMQYEVYKCQFYYRACKLNWIFLSSGFYYYSYNILLLAILVFNSNVGEYIPCSGHPASTAHLLRWLCSMSQPLSHVQWGLQLLHCLSISYVYHWSPEQQCGEILHTGMTSYCNN